MELDFTTLENVLLMLGQRLLRAKQHYEVVAIGGASLVLLGYLDQIFFKLYATVDQGPTSKHFADLNRLKPTHDELLTASKWCLTQDVSLEFSLMLKEALSALGVEYGSN